MSVLHVTNPIIFDGLDHPNPRGLYDPKLGPMDKHAKCHTCHLGYSQCPGHFGHIELILPVYNPINFRLLYKLLQSVCYYCHHLRVSKNLVYLYAAKLKLLYAGLVSKAAELDNFVMGKKGEDETEEVDYAEDFIQRIDDFVSKSLKEQVGGKAVLVTDAIRRLERQFLNAIPSLGCQNCRGKTPKFRTDGMKIYEKPLSKKDKSLMNARGLRQKDLFGCLN